MDIAAGQKVTRTLTLTATLCIINLGKRFSVAESKLGD